jgi:predicted NBD/HSP70 family sugar kinase
MNDQPVSLREEGVLRLLQALRDHGPSSRSALARRTLLSRSTVSSLVTDLAARGLVAEEGDDAPDGTPRGIGRPAGVVSLSAGAGYAVGVDIGHQHLRVAVCNLRGERVAESATTRDVDTTPRETLDLAAEHVRSALDDQDTDRDLLLGIGLGIAAPVHTDTGEIEAAGIMPGWVGINPGEQLAHRTGFPVTVTNDADAGALGERVYGAGRGVNDLIYLRLSAGVGAGIVAGGQPLRGSVGLAGEIGHVRVVADGAVCRCGNRGCLETVASPVTVARLLSQSWNRDVTWSEALDLLNAGDPGATRAVTDAGIHVGRAVAGAVNLLNPRLVVVGGDLARAGDTLLEPIRAGIARNALPSAAQHVEVVAGELGEHAEVLGAATTVLAEAPRVLAARR